MTVLTYVKRPAQAYSAATHNLFTVTGGPCIIMSIYGYVTVAISASPFLDFTFQYAPTSGATTFNIGTLTFFENQPVGNFTVVSPDWTSALTLGQTNSAHVQANGILLPGTLQALISDWGTGEIEFYITYVPLVPGAKIEVV